MKPGRYIVRAIGAAVLALAVVAAATVPAKAGDWNASVTLTVGGAAIIGGAYMMWNVSVTKRVAKENRDGEDEVLLAGARKAEDNRYVRGSGAESGISPDVHMNLVTIRF